MDIGLSLRQPSASFGWIKLSRKRKLDTCTNSLLRLYASCHVSAKISSDVMQDEPSTTTYPKRYFVLRKDDETSPPDHSTVLFVGSAIILKGNDSICRDQLDFISCRMTRESHEALRDPSLPINRSLYCIVSSLGHRN